MARKKKKKRNRLRLILPILSVVAFLVVGTMFANDYAQKTGEDSNTVYITVESGASTTDIANTLKQQQLIKYPLFFRIASRISGHDGKYKLGTFGLNKTMGYETIMESLQGIGTSAEAVKVTIPEGFELRQIADRLEEKGLINKTAFYDAVEKEQFDYDFVKDIPKRENRLEGYLFPDTYIFEKNTNEKTIVNAMLKRFDEVYNAEYKARAKEWGMTTDEVVTLASIIEREAVGDADRTTVSSVFHNRIKDTRFPYLQSCATVQYILKERKAVLSESDTKIKSPYNTYINKGLPLGPIASPGKKSIEAALYPADTEYLFFVLDSTGKHLFAKTYEQHLQNANK